MKEYLEKSVVLDNVLDQMQCSKSLLAMQERIQNLECADVAEQKHEPDMDLLVKCAIEAGASVTIADNGNGGIYINGKKITDVKKLLEDFFNGIESEVSDG